jgi:hypothetical protein
MIGTTPDTQVTKKSMWMLAAFAPPVGPIVYFLFGRKRGMPVGGERAGA